MPKKAYKKKAATVTSQYSKGKALKKRPMETIDKSMKKKKKIKKTK